MKESGNMHGRIKSWGIMEIAVYNSEGKQDDKLGIQCIHRNFVRKKYV